jgi:hypothetical protein
VSLSSVSRRISRAVTLWRVSVNTYPKDQYCSNTVICHYHQLPEGSIPQTHGDGSLSSVTEGSVLQSHCEISLSSVTRRISTAVKLPRVSIISYPKDQYRSHTATCPYHQLPEGSVTQSHCHAYLSSDTRRISTKVPKPRAPIKSYPKDQYISHTVTGPYHQLPEESVPQSHCDLTLSSVTRRISTSVTLWRVHTINYPKNLFLSHTVTCPYYQIPEGSLPQSHYDVSLSSVTRRINTAVTLSRVPIVSYPKGQYSSQTVTCPYHQLSEGPVPQLHCDVSLSSFTRRISTAVTMWRVPIIS